MPYLGRKKTTRNFWKICKECDILFVEFYRIIRMVSAFEKFSSRVIRLPMKDIDTDIIIPAQFLKTTTKTGLGKNVFYNLRNLPSGEANPDFPMNRPEFSGSRIVVAGKNFGCGSSREHAPWALKEAGIDVVISSEFADIFKGNAEKNGVLPLILSEESVQKILDEDDILSEISVDLQNQEVISASGEVFSFQIDRFTKKRFLENMSDLDYLLDLAPKIRAFEKERKDSLYF